MLRHTLLPKKNKFLPIDSSCRFSEDIIPIHSQNELWPAKCRRKPVISSPDYILDVPDIKLKNSNIIDWGVTDYMATIYGHEVYIHKLNENKNIISNSNGDVGKFLKWNKSGTQLAVSLRHNFLGVYDPFIKNGIYTCKRAPHTLLPKVTVIEYTSKYLLVGTGYGYVQFWTTDLQTKYIDALKAHEGACISLKVSCREQYLLTWGKDKFLKIWDLRSKKPLINIIFKEKLCNPVFDWHPWREPIFAIGNLEKNFYNIINVNEVKTSFLSDVYCYKDGLYDVVHNIKFNPISAELVVSFTKSFSDGNVVSNIIVLGSSSNVIDELNYHEASVCHLLWNYDGTKLATAGEDENLGIWEFFGKKDKVHKEEDKEPNNWGYSIRTIY